MECDICRNHEWVRHCRTCGGDFCDMRMEGNMEHDVYRCMNGCIPPTMELYTETIPDEEE